MPLNRPTLKELIDRGAGDIESRLPGADARLRRSNLAVLSRVQAGAAHGLYGFISHIAKQIIVDTADGDYLERWGAIWGITRKSAGLAIGEATVAGTTGAFVPEGTVLQRSDGVQFVTLADATLVAGAATLSLQAVDAGVDGNTVAGSQLLITSAIAGVGSAATVSAEGLVNGADVEDDDGLRERVLFRIQSPPQGGAENDYEAWALQVAGVTRVWVREQYMGAGTVGIFFVRDGDPDIIPSEAEIEAVAAHIDPLRPVTADVQVFAPEAVVVNFTIRLTPDTTAIRAAVEAELRDMIARDAEPGATILRSHITEAISIAAGEFDHEVTAPAVDVEMAAGQMGVFGAITWL